MVPGFCFPWKSYITLLLRLKFLLYYMYEVEEFCENRLRLCVRAVTYSVSNGT